MDVINNEWGILATVPGWPWYLGSLTALSGSSDWPVALTEDLVGSNWSAGGSDGNPRPAATISWRQVTGDTQ